MNSSVDDEKSTAQRHDLEKRYRLCVVLRSQGIETTIWAGYDTQTELRAKYKVAKDFVRQGVLRSAEASDLRLNRTLAAT